MMRLLLSLFNVSESFEKFSVNGFKECCYQQPCTLFFHDCSPIPKYSLIESDGIQKL